MTDHGRITAEHVCTDACWLNAEHVRAEIAMHEVRFDEITPDYAHCTNEDCRYIRGLLQRLAAAERRVGEAEAKVEAVYSKQSTRAEIAEAENTRLRERVKVAEDDFTEHMRNVHGTH